MTSAGDKSRGCFHRGSNATLARKNFAGGRAALVEIALQQHARIAAREPRSYAGCVTWHRFKFLPQHEFEALTPQQQLNYVDDALNALNRAVATQPLAAKTESGRRADAAQTNTKAFTWLSIDEFKRLTPAQKEAYIGQLAEHFELTTHAADGPLKQRPDFA